MPEPATQAGRALLYNGDWHGQKSRALDSILAIEAEAVKPWREWAERWVAAREARKGMSVPIGSVPPWDTLATARALNEELDDLIGSLPLASQRSDGLGRSERAEERQTPGALLATPPESGDG